MKRVLLLNPPGDRYFIRDYYCSHISKGSYYWMPLDLLVLSGVLKGRFEVHVLDAIVRRLSAETSLRAIKKSDPDCVISVAGAVSWNQDMDFLSRVKALCDVPLVISGDYPLADPGGVIRAHPFVDAVLTDFTDSEIVDFIEGEKTSCLKNVFTAAGPAEPLASDEQLFSFPVPQYPLFGLKDYHLPHILHHPFATVMTDFSCPYTCTFCPFERIKYKVREESNLQEELSFLAGLGIREIWFRDQSFGSHKEHAMRVCALVKKTSKAFSWSAEMRVDAAQRELLAAMKESGCHTVMFGVESASQEVLSRHNKGINLEQVNSAFRLARELGLRTLAHFIFGLQGEDVHSQKELIDFCLALNPDFVSFNIAAPLCNTTFKEEVLRQGLCPERIIEADSSCSYPVWESGKLKREDVWGLRSAALRRFYLRPSYILNHLKNIKTAYQLRSLIREGLSLRIK